MIDFDRLNRETREWNNRSCPAPSQRTPTSTGQQRQYCEQWQNYYNNQTYKQNNGQYTKKFY
jgi:hypothetical protein